MVALPVSGLEVTLAHPGGEEDVLLCESPRHDTTLAVALLSRLARSDGAPLQCESLTVTDLEVLLLQLRRMVLGDVVRGETGCSSPDCGARVDVTFRISEYLAHHARRPSPDAAPAD